jgi:circadian clock protein KaiC
VSSLMDTWIQLRETEVSGERNRTLYVLKSRGMAHSNQVREVLLTPHGIQLVNVYLGAEGTLTGAARLAQEAREKAAAMARQQEATHRRRELERKRQALEARITALRLELAAEVEDAERSLDQEEARETQLLEDRQRMARARKVSLAAETGGPPPQEDQHVSR